MELTTMLWILAIGLGVMAYMNHMNRKKVSAKNFGLMAIGLAALLTLSGNGALDSLSMGDLGDSISGTNGVISGGNCQVKVYDEVNVNTETYGSNSYTTAAGTVKFYVEGTNPTLPNSNPIDTITVSSGIGNTTNGKLKSCTNYGVVFDGSTTYYDMWYQGVQLAMLPYTATDAATISSTVIDFEDIMTVATIDDPIDESAVTGVVNGQTSVVNATTGTNEICIGDAETPADDDALVYDVSVGDGQFYVDLAVGFSGGNKAVKDPVICFVNDLSNPFDGNEFSSVTAQLRTGTDFGIPSDITAYVNNADCVSLGVMHNGGESGTYRLTFNVDESLLTAGGDKMYIYIDDMGDHLGQDLLRGTKATASDAVTLYTQA
jgi:hypothetical protein